MVLHLHLLEVSLVYFNTSYAARARRAQLAKGALELEDLRAHVSDAQGASKCVRVESAHLRGTERATW